MEAPGVTVNEPVVLLVTRVAPLSRLKEVPPAAEAESTAEAPAQIVALLSVGTGKATADTEIVAVVTQEVRLLRAVTVKVVRPADKPVAVAVAVLAFATLTPAGALTVKLLPALTSVLRVTGCPTQTAVPLPTVAVTEGKATTDTLPTAVAVQPVALLTRTV